MKFKTLALGAVAAFSLGSFAQAQTTTIRVTGATAFREAAHNAIKNAYTSVNYAYTSTNFGNANQAIFVGTFPGITGTTIVKTSWSGSIEGFRDVALTNNITYLTNATTVSAGGTQNAATTANEGPTRITFSDVAKDASPYAGLSWSGDKVAVQVFAVIGTPNIGDNQNITQKQFQTAFRNGFIPKSYITGLAADNDGFVFATGRNDGSGTRTVYCAESNIGDGQLASSYRSNTLQQWRMEGAAPHSAIRLWPTGDGANASIIWNGDVFDGNGGYSSGSTLRGLMDDTMATNVDVQAPDGSVAFTVPGAKLSLITSISAVDAAAAITAGAKLVSWNGSKITPQPASSGGLSAADRLKVAYGQYSLWSYEYLYNLGSSGGELTFFNKLLADTQLITNIGGNGLALSEMFVERVEEGAQITVKP